MDKPFKINDEYDFLTQNLICEEYISHGLSDAQIAAKYCVGSKVTVWRRRQFYGIPNRYSDKSNRNASVNRTVIMSKDDATKMLASGKTHQEIAKIIGASRMSVFRRLQELGLTTVKKHSQNKLRWYVELSDTQVRFLLGTLLGDGSLSSGGLFICNHCAKQKSYISHKRDILRTLLSPDFELTPISGTATKGGAVHYGFQVKTQQNHALRQLRSVFYPKGVKVFPYEYLTKSNFDASSLAYWYMDDGSRNANSAILSTYGFGFVGNTKILAFLKERFGIFGVLAESKLANRSPDARHFIRFNKDEAAKLFVLIAPYVSYGMEYKIPSSMFFVLRN